MTIEPIVFFDLVIATVVLAAVLGVVVISYVKTIQKFRDLQRKESDIEAEAHQKAGLILQEAREKATKIIGEITFSQDQLRNSFEEHLKEASAKSAVKLEGISEEFLKSYQNTLINLRNNNIKIISNISKDVENTTRSELQNFGEALKKETIDSQKIVDKKIEEEYEKTEKELESYRTEAFKKINDQIYNIIQNISNEILGKSISLQDHEWLIINALEKAKKQGLL
jgi:F0F1-type ATP synthase membrane subunit b/b'